MDCITTALQVCLEYGVSACEWLNSHGYVDFVGFAVLLAAIVLVGAVADIRAQWKARS